MFACKFYHSLAQYLPCEYFIEPPAIDFNYGISKDNYDSENLPIKIAKLAMADNIDTKEVFNKSSLQQEYDEYKLRHKKMSQKFMGKFFENAQDRS